MDKYKLNGINISCKQKCQETKLTFKMINDIIKNNIFLIPPFQPSLDDDKITSMVNSYIDNEDYLIFKNKIVVAVINETKLYLIDGHHRLQMANILYEKDYNDYLICCYFLVKNDEEMRKLFIEINRDSFKNHNYITLNEFTFNIVDIFKEYLKQKYSIYFAERKSKEKYLYTIDEFINKLIEINYFNKFLNIDELIKDIEIKHNKFNKLINYQEDFYNNNDNFYKDEFLCIINNKIFSLKNNNFINYLNNDFIIPEHIYKNKKIKIPAKLRIQVWNKYYGSENEGVCPICTNKIGIFIGFHCGHIISEYNKGKTDIDNLRPLCSNCNLKMNKLNWDDYLKKNESFL